MAALNTVAHREALTSHETGALVVRNRACEDQPLHGVFCARSSSTYSGYQRFRMTCPLAHRRSFGMIHQCRPPVRAPAVESVERCSSCAWTWSTHHQHRKPGSWAMRSKAPDGRPGGPRLRGSGDERVQPGAGPSRSISWPHDLVAIASAGLRSHPRHLRHRRAVREPVGTPVLGVGALGPRGAVVHVIRGGRAGHLLLLPRSDAGLRPERDSGDGPHRGR